MQGFKVSVSELVAHLLQLAQVVPSDGAFGTDDEAPVPVACFAIEDVIFSDVDRESDD